MKYNPDIHNRRSTRLTGYNYSQAGAYFLTLCSLDRQCIFGDILDGNVKLNEYGKIIHACWHHLPQRYSRASLDAFVIMPNHIHGILMIDDDNVGAIHELPLQNESLPEYPKQRRKMLIPQMIGWFKMNSAKQINQISDRPGYPVWQRNYYDHIIRDETELTKIRDYIINNPLNWKTDEDYRTDLHHQLKESCKQEKQLPTKRPNLIVIAGPERSRKIDYSSFFAKRSA